jgi:hypothetical protein
MGAKDIGAKDMGANDLDADVAFVEQTAFVIFLWVGVWGLIELCLTVVSKNARIIIYCLLVLFSSCAVYLRGHTKKLASL